MRTETVAAAAIGTRLLSLRLQVSESLDHVLKASHVLAQYQPVPQRLVVT